MTFPFRHRSFFNRRNFRFMILVANFTSFRVGVKLVVTKCVTRGLYSPNSSLPLVLLYFTCVYKSEVHPVIYLYSPSMPFEFLQVNIYYWSLFYLPL